MITKQMEKDLIEAAINVRRDAFSPFSNSSVGISVLVDDGKSQKIFSGHNIEFTRSTNIHGEPYTLAKVLSEAIGPMLKGLDPGAISERIKQGFKEVVAIAEVNSGGIPGCGPCRQVVLEVNPEMIFYGVKPDGTIVVKEKITALYPHYYRSNDNFRL